jgi:hypothetical protein
VNDSWDNARRHPAVTVVGLFAAGLVGVALISYLGPGGGELYASLIRDLAAGCCWVCWGGERCATALMPRRVPSAL